MSIKLKQSDFDTIDEYLRLQYYSPCKGCHTEQCWTYSCTTYNIYTETYLSLSEKVNKLLDTSGLLEEYLSQRSEYIYCKCKIDECTKSMRKIEPKMKKLQAKIRKKFE